MPGGYDGYLDSLRWVAESVQEAPPSRADLAGRIANRFDLTNKSADNRVGFLRRVRLIQVDSGVVVLPEFMKSWLLDGDPTPLMVQLHRRLRFIGEMLEALDDPRRTAELLQWACERYGFIWTTSPQIDLRRGWLQSAGLMREEGGLLYRTDAGTAFLDLVVAEPPFDRTSGRLATNAVDAGSLGRIQHDTAEHHPRQATYVSWEDRASGVLPMPGGYDGYLDSLRWLAKSVQEFSPTRAEIAERMAERFNLTDTSVETRVSFLQKVDFLRIESGSVVLPNFMKSWLRDGDSTHVIVQLHLGAQFVGEMLRVLEEPTTTVELHRLACEQYAMGWKTDTQIGNRRGWLQSAGLIRYDKGSRCLYRTDKGTDFLDIVVVEPPLDPQPQVEPLSNFGVVTHGREIVQEEPQIPDLMPVHEQAQPSGAVAELFDRIVKASTVSTNPTEFELAVRDAFDFLGFDAKHLGGSGKTDVLVDARLGSDISYRIAIDAKTTASASVSDDQVNWLTLRDHRKLHNAGYSMIVGPNPSAGRLLERAQDEGVAVLSAEALARLCRSHAAQPLGLADYKSMFESGGYANLAHIAERSAAAGRLAALARRLLDAIREDAEQFGHVIARDLHRALARDEGTIVATESEIQGLLHILASPLVGAIQGDPDSGYVLACSPTVTAERLRILGEALAGD